MNSVWVALVLLGLVTGGQAAAGDVGDACTSSDTCTNSNAFCDTTKTNKVCRCNTNWVQMSTACVRGHSQPCDASQCLDQGECNSGACRCNTAKGYAAGSIGDNLCACPTNYDVRNSDGHCAKVIGQSCTVASQCIDNTVCTGGTPQCTCNTANHFAAGSSGDDSCLCDSSKAVMESSSGTCRLKHSQTCSDSSPCISTTGMICSGGSCTCDTTKNFAPGSSGDETCTCAANYGLKSDGTCGKLEGQACSGSDTCVDHASCSTTCTCDVSGNWEASSANLCQCAAATHTLKADGTCGKIVGQACTASSSECMDNAICPSGATCTCDASLNRDATTASGSTCPCDANSVETDGVCYKKVGQTCTQASQCISTPGMTCADVSGTMKCTCNTTAYYAAGSDGDATCSCTSSNFNQETDGSCALKVGQACCTIGGAACVVGAVCDKQTLMCVCDTANNYKTSGTACTCADDAIAISGTTLCGLKVGGTCKASTASDVCTSGATCSLMTTGIYECECSAGANIDKSCIAGASSIVASIVVLTAGLFATCRLL